MKRLVLSLLGAAAAFFFAPAALAADMAESPCGTPPVFSCDGASCNSAVILEQGNVVEPKTGRKFFLDYPCDLKKDEKVVFILSLHGAGSIANWQRHYFPAKDLKEKYRLVIATPQAATSNAIFPGMPPIRMWMPDADDAYLHNVVDYVYAKFGNQIRSFWLAGHSQGGMTSNRLVCTPFFADKVDGWLSLSGGRLGPAEIPQSFFPKPPPGAPAFKFPANGPRPGAAMPPSCDFNYIFETGQNEIVALPDTSPWAEKYACAARAAQPDVVDTAAGHVYDTTRQNPPVPAWGTTARPGTAKVYIYPNCKGSKLVADVERLDKGHTEGLEPNVTETLIKMIVAAPAAKNGD